MFFTNTTEPIVETASKENSDLILEKTGRYVKFSNEVSQHVIENRSSDHQFTLHQTVMSIGCAAPSDSSTIENAVRATLEKASIQWNFLPINPAPDTASSPALFKSLKQSAIMKAAKKAGVIPGSRTTILTGLGCGAIASIISGAAARLLILHEPLTIAAILKSMQGIFSDQIVTSIALAVFTLLSLCFFMFLQTVRAKNPRLHNRIIAAVEAITAAKKTDAPFIGALKEQILALPMPMAIFTRSLDTLDFFTRSVLQAILSAPSEDTVGHLLWILCEQEDHIGTGHNGVPKVRSTHHYRFVDRQV